jgi:hypothetical protein
LIVALGGESGKTEANRSYFEVLGIKTARFASHQRSLAHHSPSKAQNKMLPSKTILAGAAVAGLLTGSFAVRSYAANVSGTMVSAVHNLADQDKGKHGCKGQNSCKGQGGCKAGDNGCKGKNSCRGKGGCKTTENSCKGKNGCANAR